MNWLRRKLSRFIDPVQYRVNIGRYKRMIKPQKKYDIDLSFTEAVKMFPGRNDLYAYMLHYFANVGPDPIRVHRKYNNLTSKGLGEDAFHAMWWLLIREFKPANCLEIGVYRGQIISLWTMIAEVLGCDINVSGISPFEPVGDTTSRYCEEYDYLKDTLETFDHFGLKHPTLIKGLSQDKVSLEYLRSKKWDLIYIDGSHDYEDVKKDYYECVKNLNAGGFVVFDDSSIYTDYDPKGFSFKGWEGPSRVVSEIVMKEMEFLGGVGHVNVFRKR